MQRPVITAECGFPPGEQSLQPPPISGAFCLFQPLGAAAPFGGLHHRAGPGGQPPLPPDRQARRHQVTPHYLRRPQPQGGQGGFIQVSFTLDPKKRLGGQTYTG